MRPAAFHEVRSGELSSASPAANRRRLSRLPVNFLQAADLSVVLVALSGLAIILHRAAGHRRARLGSGRSGLSARPPLGRTGSSVAVLLSVLLAGLVAAPSVAILAQAFATRSAPVVSPGEWISLFYSAGYALIGSVLAVALAIALLGTAGGGLVLLDPLLDSATLGAMAVPGLVLGSAYVIAFNGLLPLYGTPVLLLCAYVVTHLPALMRLLEAPLRATRGGGTDAARLHGLRWRARLEQVHLPVLLRPLLWAWSLAFASIYFELPLSTLLHPARREPIGVQLLAMDEALRFGAEARLTIGGVVVCLAIVLLGAVALPRWLRSDSAAHGARAT